MNLHESWWLVLFEKNDAYPGNVTIHSATRIPEIIPGKKFKVNLHFKSPSTSGSFIWNLMLLFDSYLGMDAHVDIRFLVSPNGAAGDIGHGTQRFGVSSSIPEIVSGVSDVIDLISASDDHQEEPESESESESSSSLSSSDDDSTTSTSSDSS